MKDITFEKVNAKHRDTIFKWLEEPYVKEFWDNSQAHKDDIDNFINGRIEPSDYFEGKFFYWVGLMDDQPFSMLMTLKENNDESIPPIIKSILSKTGSTYSIDYMIGNKNYYGKGLGSITLEKFTYFIQEEIDSTADTFFIDPDEGNPRAKHVYAKAGFKYIGDFIMGENSVFAGKTSHAMVKKLPISNDVLGESCKVRNLEETDLPILDKLFGASSRFKNSTKKWEDYYRFQKENIREIKVITYNDNVIGLGTLVFDSKYPSFKENKIFEINDILIADPYQGHGLGKVLLSSLEDAARDHGAKTVGLGVGLYKDYGPAQRLYYKLGYIPDGHGITYDHKNVTPGNTYRVDDELILWLTKLL